MDISTSLAVGISCLDLVGLLSNERDRQKAASIQIDLTNKILALQAQLLEVLGTVVEKDALLGTLKDRLRELESHQSEKARYELAKLGSLGEFLAYRLRPATDLRERTGEPEHYLCQPCFDAGKKSVLHVGKYTAICPLCKINGHLNSRPPIDYSGRNNSY